MATEDSPFALASLPNAKLLDPTLLLCVPMATEDSPFALASFPKDKLLIPILSL